MVILELFFVAIFILYVLSVFIFDAAVGVFGFLSEIIVLIDEGLIAILDKTGISSRVHNKWAINLIKVLILYIFIRLIIGILD